MKGLVEEKPHVKRSLKTLLLSIVAIVTVLVVGTSYGVSYVNHELSISSKIEELLKSEINSIKPSNFDTSSNSARKIFFDKEFRKQAVAKFSGSIQIETESYDDNPNPKDDITPWLSFLKFHDYLQKTYPLIHKHLTLEKPNKVGLLYTWEGSDPTLKPLMLTAHQDVVPVDPLSAGEWTYPPYSGYFDGENIWGRGTTDCKQLLIAIMQAVESLLEDGFKPTRSVILAFGCDEESSGKYGAKYIGDYLVEKIGADSIFAIVDEGLPFTEIEGDWYATPGTTEKGQVSMTIQLTTPGGHSSVPPDHTSIGIVAKLITLLENNPFKPILSGKNPYLRLLQEVAKHSNKLSEDLKRDIFRAEFDPEANQRVIDYIVQTIPNRVMIQTTQAIDVIRGGVKSNALPEFVEILFDSRVSVDNTVDEVVDHILGYVKQVSEEFDLGIIVSNETVVEKTKNGYFNVEYHGRNSLPISPANDQAWSVVAGTIKHVWKDVIFKGQNSNETIHVVPTLVTATTDTKHYLDLTPNIYRMFPMRVDLYKNGLHSINEHIGIENHLEAIAFMYELIQNADESY